MIETCKSKPADKSVKQTSVPLVVQKSLKRFGMRVTVVERGIVWDAQVPKSEANPCQHPSSIVNCIPN
jgi:hypothetical protein